MSELEKSKTHEQICLSRQSDDLLVNKLMNEFSIYTYIEQNIMLNERMQQTHLINKLKKISELMNVSIKER